MRAALLLPVGAGAATPYKAKACTPKADKAGNWEVVLGTKKTRTAASALGTSARPKKLAAVVESNGCGSFEVAVEGLKTQRAAKTHETKARADAFHASLEAS